MKRVKIPAVSKNMPGVKSYVQAATGGNQHVTPKGNKWQVKKSRSSRATKVFSTQKEAVAYAKEIAKNQQAELFVHARNGRIRERNSYGRDPFPPKG